MFLFCFLVTWGQQIQELLIYTSSNHKATLAFGWSRVSGHLLNVILPLSQSTTKKKNCLFSCTRLYLPAIKRFYMLSLILVVFHSWQLFMEKTYLDLRCFYFAVTIRHTSSYSLLFGSIWQWWNWIGFLSTIFRAWFYKDVRCLWAYNVLQNEKLEIKIIFENK